MVIHILVVSWAFKADFYFFALLISTQYPLKYNLAMQVPHSLRKYKLKVSDIGNLLKLLIPPFYLDRQKVNIFHGLFAYFLTYYVLYVSLVISFVICITIVL